MIKEVRRLSFYETDGQDGQHHAGWKAGLSFAEMGNRERPWVGRKEERDRVN